MEKSKMDSCPFDYPFGCPFGFAQGFG